MTDNGTTGVYTIHQIDVDVLKNIEMRKQALTFQFSALSSNEIKKQLNDLFSSMQMFLEKYYFDKIENFPVTLNNREFTFYDLKNLTQSINDKTMLRLIFENESQIFEHFSKQLKAAIPTQDIDEKKN